MAFDTMVFMLNEVGQTILQETFDYYHKAPTEVDGVKKWTGWLICTGADGKREGQIGILPNIQKSRAILQGKISVLTALQTTSISCRNPEGTPVVWGGGSLTELGTKQALTGGTELQDHLVLSYLQLTTRMICQDRYNAQTALEYPGIQASITDSTHLGLNPDSFVSMRSSIEAHLRPLAI